jgi:hypothetical protein
MLMLILDENNIQTKSMKIYTAHYVAGLFGKIGIRNLAWVLIIV